MDKQLLKLTSAEIAGLWETYLQNTAIQCILKHFLTFVQNAEIRGLTEEAFELYQNQTADIAGIFREEHIPVPAGFTDADVDSAAPPLFSELYALSFVYRVGQITLANNGNILVKVARQDVVKLFSNGLHAVKLHYQKSLSLMLELGIYDRPPKIEYPENREFVAEQSFLGRWVGEQRTLSAMELGEIFFVIERNYIGLLLLLGLIQATKDKEIKAYLIRGKALGEKQIAIFNELLKKEDLLEISPVTMEVTNSTHSPFSERLTLFMITTTTAASLPLLASAMAFSMRKDLIVSYSRIIAEVMLFGEDGINLMIRRGWMEQPPLAFDRKPYMKV